MHTRKESRSASIQGAAILLLALMLIWPGIALADKVTVNCDNPGGGDGVTSFGNLQAAISYLRGLDPDRFHTIEVTGTCSFPQDNDGDGQQDADPDGNLQWRPFFVADFANLTIEAPEGLTAMLYQPVLTCDIPDRDQGHRLAAVLRVSNSQRVLLRRLNITGGRGVGVSDSRAEFRGDVVVSGSHRHGVTVGGDGGSRFHMTNDPNRGEGANEISNNCRDAVNVGETSVANVFGDSRLLNNGRFGLITFNSGRVSVFGQALVEGNLAGGMAVRFAGFGSVSGQAIIRGNGENPDANNFFFPFRSGVHAYFGSTLLVGGPARNPDTGILNPGPTIESNTGPGILVDVDTNVRLRNLTVQENSGGGLVLMHQSVAEFQPENTIFSGNIPDDFECDGTSLVFGDLSGVAVNKCNQLAKEPKK